MKNSNPHDTRSVTGTLASRSRDRRWKKLVRRVVVIVSLTSLACCSWGPISAVSSLSPAVQADSVAYSDAVGDVADRILISNILRAKDYASLNLNQLSSVSGQLSLQGSLGFGFPFGEGSAAVGSNARTWVVGQNSVSPSVTASTSPSFSLTPLNTQPSTLMLLQPVQPNYVLFLLQQGLPREILLSLLVKEIDFAPKSWDAGGYRYMNDPDDRSHFLAFQDLVQKLVAANVTLRTVDVLESVGSEFNLNTASSGTTATTVYEYPSKDGSKPCKPPQPGTAVNPNDLCKQDIITKPDESPPRSADQTGYSLVTASSDAQYHVGNTPDRKHGQLYRAYAGQLVLCVNRPWVGPHRVPPLNAASARATGIDDTIATFAMRSMMDDRTGGGAFQLAMAPLIPVRPRSSIVDVGEIVPFAAPSTGGSSGNNSSSSSGGGGGGSSGGSHGGGGSSSSGGSSTQATTPALQASRISAIVYGDACQADEVVMREFDERRFATDSKEHVRIYWRSVSDIFQYLGAVLRYNVRTSDNRPIAIAVSPDRSVAAMVGEAAAPPASILFDIPRGGSGRLTLNFDGSEYSVPDINPASPRADYTRPVLTVLSMLINFASQQSTVQTSTPLRLLPLP